MKSARIWRVLTALGALPGCASTTRPVSPSQADNAAHAAATPNQVQAAELAHEARRLVEQKRSAEARARVDLALALLTPGSLDDDHRLFQLQMILAESFRYEGHMELAVVPFRRALELAERHEAQMPTQVLEALRRLASTSTNAEAAGLLEHALEVARRNPSARKGELVIAAQLAAVYGSNNPQRVRELMSRYSGVARQLSEQRFSDVSATDVLAPAPSTAAPTTGSAGAPPAPSRNVINAAQLVGAMRPDFRTCYQSELRESPQLEGSARLILSIAADGHVSTARAVGIGLPTHLLDCLLQRAAKPIFDPPEGGSAVIAVPVTFVKQD